MDQYIRRYLPEDRGVFVEAGALDGVTKSNTLMFEGAGWTGLLVEPIPAQANRARRYRKAPVEEAILTSPEFSNDVMKIVDLADSSIVKSPDEASTIRSLDEQIAIANNHKKRKNREFQVRTATLGDLLVKHEIDTVDFLCLDVEGHELQVLAGVDLATVRFGYLLIESNEPDQVTELLGADYRLVEHVFGTNYLWAHRDRAAA
jgi:FkbM family methyltransferase